MATQSRIEWTQATWNPVTGCTKISQGCKNCYAERMSHRLCAMGQIRYQHGFQVTLQEDLLSVPYRWKKPRLIFVNSMSDLFHEKVPLDYIYKVFEVMVSCPQHTFQILTKRSERLRSLSSILPWAQNIWMGVTVEDASVMHRILDLLSTPAKVKFLSCEPLLGPLPNMPLDGINWVIVGGESGPYARLMSPLWVEAIYHQCRNHNIPFFFKQWGGKRKHTSGRLLHGRTYDEMPMKQ